jgi:2-phospho-L-lactate guanylyltransferase
VSGLTWIILVPVKRLERAKTRLRGALPESEHESFTLAMALDTVAAALGCPPVGRVVAVTDDAVVADAARTLGAQVVADAPDAGLNPAIAYAASVHRPRSSASAPGLAALTADLPALRPGELAEALRAAERQPLRGYVPDAAGTGTVLLTSPPGTVLAPCFGPDSAAAHRATGAVPLEGEWPTLRCDVDTPIDLDRATRLGLGPHSRAVVSGSVAPSPFAGAGRDAMMNAMQGTVAGFDDARHSGELILDDGSRLAFPAEAFNASGLRLLRVGQRVRIDRSESGDVVRVTLPTLP